MGIEFADWIPYDVSLPGKLEVQGIARATKLSRYEVCGRLMAFWAWASRESASGFLGGCAVEDLVEVIGFEAGFWRAMEAVGWMQIDAAGISLPNPERWLTNGGKARLQENRRKADWRARQKVSGFGPLQNGTDVPVETGQVSGFGPVKDGTRVPFLSHKKRGPDQSQSESQNKSIVSSSLCLPGTQGSAGKTKKKRAPVKPSRRVVETWLTPFGELWQDVTQGVFHYAKAAAVLKPLVERHGPDVTLAAFTDYLVATPIDKLSVARFAETIGQYLAGTDGQTPARRAGGLGGPSPEDLAAEEAKKAEWIRQDLADMAAEARGGKP